MTRTIQALKIGDQTIYVEVSEVDQQSAAGVEDDGLEDVNALDDVVDAAASIRGAVSSLCETIQAALAENPPKEWTLELNLGFKGKGGIPFLAEGEANGAVKITAKWQNP